MQPLHLITAEQVGTGSMSRMSLINVAVKSGPPSARPLCCSVLVPLQCPQRKEQIVTLMMDIQPPPSLNLSAGLGSLPFYPPFPLSSCSLGEPGMVNNHVHPISFESAKTTLHTDFISADKFWGDAAQFRRLYKQKNEASRGHRGNQSQLRAVTVLKRLLWCISGLKLCRQQCLQLREYVLPVWLLCK